jgi:hypothetical protein
MTAQETLASDEQRLGVAPTALDWLQFFLRAGVCIAIVWLFWRVNAHVLDVIDAFAKTDSQQIAAKQISAGDRVITASVIMSLIAGTVAQVAIILLGITRYLFPVTA